MCFKLRNGCAIMVEHIKKVITLAESELDNVNSEWTKGELENEVESPCYHNNVHGKLCNNACVNGCNKSNIIFGIDDNLIQAHGSSSELRLFSKTYRKMLSADKYSTVLQPNENSPVALKFYGHSLSEADYSYFQSIFDYYDLYKNNKVSLTFYYSKGYENYDAVYRLISVYGKSLANKEQGKN